LLSLWRGDAPEGLPLFQSTLKISLADFAKQVSTLRVMNARDTQERLKASYDFGRFFVGGLSAVYWKAAAALLHSEAA
jgi:cholesterol oxidase